MNSKCEVIIKNFLWNRESRMILASGTKIDPFKEWQKIKQVEESFRRRNLVYRSLRQYIQCLQKETPKRAEAGFDFT